MVFYLEEPEQFVEELCGKLKKTAGIGILNPLTL